MRLSFPAHVFLLGLATAAPAYTEPSPNPPASIPPAEDIGPDALFIKNIEDAVDTGNGALLNTLVRPHDEPSPSPSSAPLNTLLARSWMMLGDKPRALRFALASIRSSKAPTPRWLAAELNYSLYNWRAGDALAAELKTSDAASPVVPYLEARRILARLADADAGFEQPMMVDARRDLRLAAAACISAEARAHHDFDPRFFSLGIDVGLFDLDYAYAAADAAQLSTLRPRNAPLARLALALAFDSPALRNNFLAALRTRGSLPASELVRWDQYARQLDLSHGQDRLPVWLSLADAARQDSSWAPVYVHLVARTAALLPASDPRFAAVAGAYADAALQASSPPHARAVLDLLPPSSDDAPAIRERRIALASLGSRHDLAAELAVAETPAHAGDFDWLSRHRSIVARHQTPGVYLQYLQAMEHLRPEDPGVLLELAQVYDRYTLPEALPCYHRVFALTPEKIHPSFHDWFAYLNLVDAAARRGQPANALQRFDETIERIHAAAPDDVPAAYFYADLLDRRARISGKSADREAADKALDHAMDLAPEAGDIFGKLGRPRTITITI